MTGRISPRYVVASFMDSVWPSLKAYLTGAGSEKAVLNNVNAWASFTHRMTTTLRIAGNAMSPTFKEGDPPPSPSSGAKWKPNGELLLIRAMRFPSAKNIFVGDIVALEDPRPRTASSTPASSPASTAGAIGRGGGFGSTLMVRRVAAMEGDELVALDASEEKGASNEDSDSRASSGDSGSKVEGGEDSIKSDEEEDGRFDSLIIPPGYCWVLADNESLPPSEAVDSRTFGPLQMSHILGRAIYSARSATDHCAVTNSEEAMEDDIAVLEAELDVEEFVKAL